MSTSTPKTAGMQLRAGVGEMNREAPLPLRVGLGRWILIVAIGEVVGFAFPVSVGVWMASSPAGTAVIVTAGFVEGAVLGGAQYLAMRRDLPGLRPEVWVPLTGGAAAVAYVCGMLPSSLEPMWTTWPVPLQLAALAVLIVAILGSVGGAQWVELRHHLRGAAWWIVGTAIAWLGGLGIFFAIAPPLWHEGQSVATAIAIGLFAAIGMAIAMAAVTGITFGLLLRRNSVGASGAPAVETT
ncbi:hypothetical protein JNB63_11960 [Microbacterium trichothecenolyticum]|uniref:hypothetical protein n=1 Tax=Microbacterium trichothecenolyticum TaxID=69370 RepID=UPI001C6F46B0|nr:hypothetical protein [Microbacterium trichothecenolyticum]MBW9120810.1 hypothetical protein [Microbacterium trichothecenolyticum]